MLPFQPKPMVSWYNVYQLLSTGLKTLVSSVFGSYADRREMQAAINITHEYDYGDREEIWVDYIADIGDGFDSTYTMAKLLAVPELELDGYKTQRGQILIMGGDQVYPDATKEHYQNRLQGPYEFAFPKSKIDKDRPHLYAIPGNHDWYDGLTNFTRLFCQKRMIGNWRTQQERSYFAIKLPHNWWIWGIDIQLDGDIDKPQLDYFRKVTEEMMTKGDKIILCTAEPSWVHSHYKNSDSYLNLKYFEENLIVQEGMDLAVTIAGDLHFYARYSIETEEETSHKIIAGGGGAFMHPTHNLKPKLEGLREGDFSLEQIYPEKEVSKKLSWQLLLFPIFNWEFTAFLGVFNILFAWTLESSSKYNAPTFLNALSHITPSFANLNLALTEYLLVLRYSPFSVVVILAVVFGLIVFTDKKTNPKSFLWVVGMLHGLAQIMVSFVFIWWFSFLNFDVDPDFFNPASHDLNLWNVSVFTAEIFLLGGLLGSFLMGLYLLISNRVLNIHDTEAFSALKWPHHKNFLRMHITPNSLIIYPIGVDKVVKWQKEEKTFTGSPIKAHLIEEPVRIEKDST